MSRQGSGSQRDSRFNFDTTGRYFVDHSTPSTPAPSPAPAPAPAPAAPEESREKRPRIEPSLSAFAQFVNVDRRDAAGIHIPTACIPASTTPRSRLGGVLNSGLITPSRPLSTTQEGSGSDSVGTAAPRPVSRIGRELNSDLIATSSARVVLRPPSATQERSGHDSVGTADLRPASRIGRELNSGLIATHSERVVSRSRSATPDRNGRISAGSFPGSAQGDEAVMSSAPSPRSDLQMSSGPISTARPARSTQARRPSTGRGGRAAGGGPADRPGDATFAVPMRPVQFLGANKKQGNPDPQPPARRSAEQVLMHFAKHSTFAPRAVGGERVNVLNQTPSGEDTDVFERQFPPLPTDECVDLSRYIMPAEQWTGLMTGPSQPMTGRMFVHIMAVTQKIATRNGIEFRKKFPWKWVFEHQITEIGDDPLFLHLCYYTTPDKPGKRFNMLVLSHLRRQEYTEELGEYYHPGKNTAFQTGGCVQTAIAFPLTTGLPMMLLGDPNVIDDRAEESVLAYLVAAFQNFCGKVRGGYSCVTIREKTTNDTGAKHREVGKFYFWFGNGPNRLHDITAFMTAGILGAGCQDESVKELENFKVAISHVMGSVKRGPGNGKKRNTNNDDPGSVIARRMFDEPTNGYVTAKAATQSVRALVVDNDCSSWNRQGDSEEYWNQTLGLKIHKIDGAWVLEHPYDTVVQMLGRPGFSQQINSHFVDFAYKASQVVGTSFKYEKLFLRDASQLNCLTTDRQPLFPWTNRDEMLAYRMPIPLIFRNVLHQAFYEGHCLGISSADGMGSDMWFIASMLRDPVLFATFLKEFKTGFAQVIDRNGLMEEYEWDAHELDWGPALFNSVLYDVGAAFAEGVMKGQSEGMKWFQLIPGVTVKPLDREHSLSFAQTAFVDDVNLPSTNRDELVDYLGLPIDWKWVDDNKIRLLVRAKSALDTDPVVYCEGVGKEAIAYDWFYSFLVPHNFASNMAEASNMPVFTHYLVSIYSFLFEAAWSEVGGHKLVDGNEAIPVLIAVWVDSYIQQKVIPNSQCVHTFLRDFVKRNPEFGRVEETVSVTEHFLSRVVTQGPYRPQPASAALSAEKELMRMNFSARPAAYADKCADILEIYAAESSPLGSSVLSLFNIYKKAAPTSLRVNDWIAKMRAGEKCLRDLLEPKSVAPADAEDDSEADGDAEGTGGSEVAAGGAGGAGDA